MRLADAVAELSHAFAGENDEEVALMLDRTRINLTEKLTREIGARVAVEIADAFVAAVRSRRAEIESSRRPLWRA